MNQLPAYLINRKPRAMADIVIAKIGGSAPPRISIKANRFTLVDGAGNEKPINSLVLDCVIVDMNPNICKSYYDYDYDSGAAHYEPPTCFSDNGIAPSSQAQKPQHIVCMTCPHNQWGSKTSAVTGKQTKACQDSMKLGVIVPSFDEGKMAFLLRVPPNSLKNLKAYAQIIKSGTIGDRPVELCDLITQVSFVSQGTLAFAPASFITEEIANAVTVFEDEDKTAMLVGRNDVPFQGALPAPEKRPEPAVVQTAPVQIAPAAAPAPRGRGRPLGSTKKTEAQLFQPAPEPIQAARPAPAEAEIDELPAFLRPKDQQKPFNVEAAPAAPDAALKAMLDSVFNLPT